jgi:hypothetical protein
VGEGDGDGVEVGVGVGLGVRVMVGDGEGEDVGVRGRSLHWTHASPLKHLFVFQPKFRRLRLRVFEFFFHKLHLDSKLPVQGCYPFDYQLYHGGGSTHIFYMHMYSCMYLNVNLLFL